ncbi:MAG: glycosyltransferase family 9 protein [Candidatus Omnitrophica bacterium]|nr:glycosyltransferase family 9 protein [Candidatus Omnitrophota bacterium]
MLNLDIAKNRQIKKILIVRNDRFGEFLLNIPAFRALEESFPQAEIWAVINPYVKELAELTPYIERIIVWENKKHNFFEILKFSFKLKKEKFDLCIIFNPSKEFNIISFLAGIPIRVGYARKWPFLLTHKIEDKKYLGLKHEIEYNLELVGLVGAKTEDKSLSLKIDIEFDPPQFREYKGIVAIHPWSSDIIKNWKIENFVELAKRISLDKNLGIVIIGGKENLLVSEKYFGDIKEKNIINLVGKTNLKELASLLKRCKLLITSDSGPMHLAVCVGTRVIALFRNDIATKSARRWGPWGGQHIVIEKEKLSKITVEEVFDKINQSIKIKRDRLLFTME